MKRNSRRQDQAGQALVLMALALVTIVAGMGLIVDGGNLWAHQRMTQQGNDAAAEAGAVVLAKYLGGEAAPGAGWDSAVDAAVDASAGKNAIAIKAAYYTDICGTLLRPNGTKATDPNKADAAVVGAGTLPTNNNTNPDCPAGVVGPVSGVLVEAERDVRTVISQVVGFSSFKASTTATAVAGLLQGSCDANSGCVVLPVTAPVTVVTCGTNGEAELTPTPWPTNTRVIVPLCKNNPGNVGWLDWTPKGGGASELEASIRSPNNPPIALPSWNYVTSTGNVNSKGIEDALNSYIGQVVLFPMFDLTCGDDPDHAQVSVGPDYGCPDIGGSGQNQWYRIPQFAGFELERAHLNGSNAAACDTGNGATSCLIGKFVSFVTAGTVGPGIGGGTTQGAVLGVQLIR